MIDFDNRPGSNRFLAVRELKLTGLRTPNYNRRADLVCFVNGLPLVFIELKAVYKNIRAGFDGNLRDYMDENVIAHAFHHNAFLIVSNGHRARYGSITSEWDNFAEWKAAEEDEKGSATMDRKVSLNGMLAHDRLLDRHRTSSCSTKARRARPARWWRATIRCSASTGRWRRSRIKGKSRTAEAASASRHRTAAWRALPSPTRSGILSDELAEAPQCRTPAFVPPKAGEHRRARPPRGWRRSGTAQGSAQALLAEKVRRKVPGISPSC